MLSDRINEAARVVGCALAAIAIVAAFIVAIVAVERSSRADEAAIGRAILAQPSAQVCATYADTGAVVPGC